MAVEVHVPEPVLGGGETLGKKEIPLVLRPDVGDAPRIPVDLDFPLEAGQLQGGPGIRKRGFEIVVSDVEGHEFLLGADAGPKRKKLKLRAQMSSQGPRGFAPSQVWKLHQPRCAHRQKLLEKVRQ